MGDIFQIFFKFILLNGNVNFDSNSTDLVTRIQFTISIGSGNNMSSKLVTSHNFNQCSPSTMMPHGVILYHKRPSEQLYHWPLGDLNVIFKNVIFNLALLIGIFKSPFDIVLRWMPQDLTDDKSILVQVMACCLMAPSHYLNQCWPKSPTPYGVTRPQWVKRELDNWKESKLFLWKTEVCSTQIK